ncbi:MAG TPA: Gfo/Idh/MocA family oxidoreductase [Clostridia bacterium]|nr:Gfo/Idh/MocA family oxidoreductase [Clostridia bacterium]
MKDKLNRRRFLLATTTLAAAGMHALPTLRVSAYAGTSVKMPETIRVGIIGLDGHCSEITGALKVCPNLRITAIAENKPDLLRPFRSNPATANARFYQDYQQLLDHETLEVVAVCGENGVRARIVTACAERGIPIAAEKPLALSLSELTAVKKVLSARRIPLTMLLPMRCSPQFQAMREVIRSGQIGEVVAIDAQKSYRLGTRPDWMKNRRTFGGTIPYIGIHMVDLMRWTTGRDFVQVGAFQSTVGAPQIGDMENNAALIFKMENRGTATLHLDYLRPAAAASHGDDRLRVVGTKGIVEYQEGRGLTLVTESQPMTKIDSLPPAKHLFADFIASLYQGTPHLIQPDEIYRVTEIVLKAREAAERNRLVQL